MDVVYLNAAQSPEFGAQSDGERVATEADTAEVFIETFRQRAPVTERTPERTTTLTHTYVHTHTMSYTQLSIIVCPVQFNA